jgi:peptide/nickel transport system substrate-binding protein
MAWHRRWLAAGGLIGLAALGGCRDSGNGTVIATVIGERLPALSDAAAKPPTAADLVLTGNAAQGLVRFDAAGNIAPGLAERWAVSDDGLSYVFRLQKTNWSDGRKVRARDIVRLLQRQLAKAGSDPVRDSIGAIAQVVAMTDRVIAIELSAPRPHLLQLLAQPEFGLVSNGQGTGPFGVTRKGETLVLSRTLPGFDGDQDQTQEVTLVAAPAERAVADFTAGKTELVLGGTVGDLSVPLGAKLPRGALHIDPVAGLFGLVPARNVGPAADPEVRALFDEALDRNALVGALGVPDLQPRASILQLGLDGVTAPVQPDWTATAPTPERRQQLVAIGNRLFPRASGAQQPPTLDPPRPILIALPQGPGGAIILQRLKADWEPLGYLTVEAAKPGGPADFRWVDAVAPSTSPAWFLRSLRCEFVPVCSEEADKLLDAARLTGFVPQRNAFFADAERLMREKVLFIPVAAPVRWSLVGRGIEGFADNRFARHTLTDLRAKRGTQD